MSGVPLGPELAWRMEWWVEGPRVNGAQGPAGLLVSGESSATSSASQEKLLLESAQKLSSLKLRT